MGYHSFIKEEQNLAIYSNMGRLEGNYPKGNNSDRERETLQSNIHGGFPGGARGKEPTCQCWSPGSGGAPGGGHATHPRILAWRIPMDRGAWQAAAHGVTESRTTTKAT